MLLSIDKTEQIHYLLNEIYAAANKDFAGLKKLGTECKLLSADKNYIKIQSIFKEFKAVKGHIKFIKRQENY